MLRYGRALGASETAIKVVTGLAGLTTFALLPDINDLGILSKYYNIQWYLNTIYAFSNLFGKPPLEVASNLVNAGFVVGPSVDIYRPIQLQLAIPEVCPAQLFSASPTKYPSAKPISKAPIKAPTRVPFKTPIHAPFKLDKPNPPRKESDNGKF